MLHLGMIPDWQFSNDPAVNRRINPNVVFPAGWNQMTVQPVGTYINSGDPASLSGLRGGFFDSWIWTNRKSVGVGILGAGIIGLAALAAKFLR